MIKILESYLIKPSKFQVKDIFENILTIFNKINKKLFVNICVGS